jgi:hypothetical protein
MKHYNKHFKDKLKWLNNYKRNEKIGDIIGGICLIPFMALILMVMIYFNQYN